MTKRFSGARKGDKVMCYLNGEGRILSVANHGISHPITVEFREGRSEYTLCGRRSQADQNPTLFYTGVVFTAEGGDKPTRCKRVHGFDVPDIAFKPTTGDYYHTPVLGPQRSAYVQYGDAPSMDAWREYISIYGAAYGLSLFEQEYLSSWDSAVAHAMALLERPKRGSMNINVKEGFDEY